MIFILTMILQAASLGTVCSFGVPEADGYIIVCDDSFYPFIYYDREAEAYRGIAAEILEEAAELFGGNVLTSYPASGLNEDFSKYSKVCPIMYAFIGAANDAEFESYPLHSPKFRLDEEAIKYAAGVYIKTAVEFLD